MPKLHAPRAKPLPQATRKVPSSITRLNSIADYGRREFFDRQPVTFYVFILVGRVNGYRGMIMNFVKPRGPDLPTSVEH
jgi:hypothetical protein